MGAYLSLGKRAPLVAQKDEQVGGGEEVVEDESTAEGEEVAEDESTAEDEGGVEEARAPRLPTATAKTTCA
eukprot:g19682.t1